jgi:nitrite reductase/ring-hydroxylating ferredoxin subunit
MDAICTHEGAQLEEGRLQEYLSLALCGIWCIKWKVSDATVWPTDLESYPVEVEVNHNRFDGIK